MKSICLTGVSLVDSTRFVVLNPVAALVRPVVAGVLVADKLLSLRTVVAAENTWGLLARIDLECVVSHCFVGLRVLLPESGIFVRGSNACEDHLMILTPG